MKHSRTWNWSAVCAAAIVGAAGVAGAQELTFEDVIARVEIETGGGSAIEVSVDNPANEIAAPQVRREGASVVLIGQDIDVEGCRGDGDDQRLRLRGRDDVRMSDLPVVRVSAPRDVDLRIAGGFVTGEAGEVGSADIAVGSCADFRLGAVARNAAIDVSGAGDFEAGDVGGDLRLDVSGAGDVMMGSVKGALFLDVSGAGDVGLGAIGSTATIDISGAGDAMMAAVGGDVAADISGSGEVTMRDIAGEVRVDLSGSADFRGGGAKNAVVGVSGSGSVILGAIGSLKADASGAGDVKVRSVDGDAELEVSGAGQVDIDGGRIDAMTVYGDGGGSVRFDGDVKRLSVTLSGGAGLHVRGEVGEIERRNVSRGADLKIGG